MSHFPYQSFEKYIIRTPLFSREEFQKKVECKELSEIEIKKICLEPIFQEAVYLASPYLYEEINQWLNGQKKLSDKLKNTILKYYSRMSTRCTPFGLFSGVGLGDFNDEIKRLPNSTQIRDTKLDMHFLVALSKSFEKNPTIKNKLLYFPNTSIYIVGNKIRFVEYEFLEGKRDYIISSAPISEELEQILKFSISGKTIFQLKEILTNKDVTDEEAVEFIQELIDNQVLVSELEPNVSGEEFLSVLIKKLKRLNADSEVRLLISIQEKLENIDEKIGNNSNLYSEIEELIASFQTEYEHKYLFQTDLYHTNEFHLSNSWKKKLKNTIRFLNKITLANKDTHLEKFKKAFLERYETEEIPLSIALDSEIGIGYRQDFSSKGIHPYLDDLIIPLGKSRINQTIQLNAVHQILNDKLQESILENQNIIKLSDDDFSDFEEKWNDLPDTISFMTEIISEHDVEKIMINGGGGSSAANLLGRFCSKKSEIQNLVKEITKKEEELNSDFILAEIIHLPEARIGNVVRRPTLRSYEIPYLAQSILPKENQILINDLMISIKNNRIVIRSIKFNKEVKPYLTNAHNFSINSLPVYHFLCDVCSQNKRSGLYFDWGGLKNIYKYLPRVEYNNVILSKAQWKVEEKDVQSLISLIAGKDEFLSELKNWRIKRKIPNWIQWAKSDNTLTMNLDNYDFAKLFIETIKKEKTIIIEEFVWNKNDDFARQFIFPFYKIK
ncbi:lantibiotic dehydratase family protein [Chryseobacterium sp.]|uniref:lantibiotic dehydratase family protein n=1 Tax=Chryseobacterium sp. TaxID=1871047 RepID=UPI0028A01D65|nr:lantibiotic dehydratase family protein [Chryseobacterium sp.]